MAIDVFIPKVYAAKALKRARAKTVYGNPAVLNTDYQAAVAQFGDTVVIPRVGEVAVRKYTGVVNYDLLDGDAITLTIDEADYWAFKLPDIDAKQSAYPLLNDGVERASSKMAQDTDRYLAGLYTSAGTILPAHDGMTADEAYELFAEAQVALDEKNIDESGRSAIVPPWLASLLAQSKYFTSTGTGLGDTSVLTGFVGQAAGFTVLKSNNTPVDGTGHNIAQFSTRDAISFADQIPAGSVEQLRDPASFSTLVRGLHVYGSLVVNEDALLAVPVKR